MKFFKNEIDVLRNERSTYNVILKHWKGDYDKLEDEHGYIQWLFPMYQKSMFNHNSQELQLHELKVFNLYDIIYSLKFNISFQCEANKGNE